MWQTLTCRGKYAGEIRLEITFYDSRPKPDKPAARPRHSMSADLESSSPKRKEIVKRRPLPTDPVTGEVTANVPGQIPSSDFHQGPPRPHGKPNPHSPYGSTNSLHETAEYGGGPAHGSTRSRHADHFSSPSPVAGSGRVEGPRQPRPTRQDSYERERGYSQKIPVSPYEQQDPRGSSYSLAGEAYDMNPAEDPAQYGGPRQAAPPPPAHRSRHSNSQEQLQRRGDEHSPQRAIPPASMRSDVLKNEAHRNTTPTYPGRPQFRAYDPTLAAQPPIQKAITYEPHNSYDAYDAQYRSMQPTVEDVPESPTGSMRNRPRRSSSRIPPLDEIVYDTAPIPLSSSLSRSPGGGSGGGYLGQSPGGYPPYQEQPRNPNSVSPLSARDYTESPGQMTQYSYSSQSQRPNQQREHETTYFQSSPSYGLPALPPSLAPGVDPNMAQDMSNRAYDERQYDGRYNNQIVSASPRDHHRSEPPPPSHEPAYGTSPQAYESYDRRRSGGFDGAPDPQAQAYRDASPNPQHRIRRKSVSPAPARSDHRRHSDIPFGPDSYDTFNPGMSSRDGSPGLDPSDSPSKIVTPDGREIDPSDHLPVESWAPEPEAKPSQEVAPPRRPPLSGAQPMPPSGRRPLRISMARTSQAVVPSNAYNYSEAPRAPPAQGGRQRLQKKAQRHSMGPTPSAPNPLGPIAPDNFQDRQNQYSSTRSRAGAWDYPNENYAPQYNGGGNQGPPIPAKVPLPIMSGANGGAEDMALIQEMQKIDIGTGRSRRRGGY